MRIAPLRGCARASLESRFLPAVLAALVIAAFAPGAAHAARLFDAAVRLDAGHQPYSLAVADVNGDGEPDLVVPAYGDDSVAVMLAHGDGTYATRTRYARVLVCKFGFRPVFHHGLPSAAL